jgi:hypothetical protein
MNYNDAKKLKKGDCVWYINYTNFNPDEYEILFSTIERVNYYDDYDKEAGFLIKIRENKKSQTKIVYEKVIFITELEAIEHLLKIKSQDLVRNKTMLDCCNKRVFSLEKQIKNLSEKILTLKEAK